MIEGTATAITAFNTGDDSNKFLFLVMIPYPNQTAENFLEFILNNHHGKPPFMLIFLKI